MKNKKRSLAISWFITNYKFSGFLAFALLFVGISYITFQRYYIIKGNERREMASLLNVIDQNVEQTLKNGYATALSLALTINDKGNPVNFEEISDKILETNPSIDIVQLVPNGIIKYTNPLEDNKRALNLNIFEHPSAKKGAYEALKSKKMYYSGPVQLRQGGVGVIGRLPIFKDEKFWGFSTVIIKLETLRKASGIDNISNSKYFFQFTKKNEVTGKLDYFLGDKKDFSDKTFLKIDVTDGNWRIYVISKNNYAALHEVFPMALLGLLLSIFIGFFIGTILKKPNELQNIVKNQANTILNTALEFNTIFEQASVGITHIDQAGNFIAINKQFCEILGYSTEEIRSKKFEELTHPDDISENLRLMNDLKAEKISDFNFEKRYFHKNKNIIWAKVHVYPLKNSDQKTTSYITIIEDISEKKLANENIKISETRFKSLFDDSPVALWEEDFSLVKECLKKLGLIGKNADEVASYFEENPDFVRQCISQVKIININNECLTLHYPKTKEELMDSLENVLNNEIRDTFVAQLIAITQGQKYLSMDSKVKKSDGEMRDISLRWNVMRGYEESLERIIISTEDITARKASEEIIIESQKKIESIVNAIDGIVWESNLNTNTMTFVNKKAEEITGYTKEEWLSDPHFWDNKIHPEDREFAVKYSLEHSQKSLQYDFEYRFITKNGSIIWIRDIVNVIHENGKPVSLKGIMIDITNKKKAEKELSDSFDLMTEQNKRLLNFSYIVSHNLRSHASNIQAISNLIETVESDEERLEMIEMLQKVSSALNESMLNLNEVVNIQTNLNLVRKSLNLRENIDKIINILSEQVALKKAEIINEVDSEIFVNYNPAYLESVLLNFLSNALRYSHPDRIPLITIKCQAEIGQISLKISDNGMGIDLERDGTKLFGMYKTFHKNPDSKGIGLFISKNQIDAMGGSVTAESEPGVGTTFTIIFR